MKNRFLETKNIMCSYTSMLHIVQICAHAVHVCICVFLCGCRQTHDEIILILRTTKALLVAIREAPRHLLPGPARTKQGPEVVSCFHCDSHHMVHKDTTRLVAAAAEGEQSQKEAKTPMNAKDIIRKAGMTLQKQ